jgi:primosomal protein N' (replication factor Y)
MPEISLTPQIEKRLKKYFGNTVAIWHSKQKNKKSILQNIYNKKIRVVAGARSALILPIENIGIIIVDEEHDDSYKSQSKPKINARDIAIYLGNRVNAKVVLGSATPSLVSFYKYPFYRLKGSFFESQKKITFISGDFDTTILNRAMSQNRQAIVFTPTRANFKYMICKDCGSVVECPNCSVSMSLHKRDNRLKCHYCNYMMQIPKICSNCSKEDFEVDRIGTAEIANILELEYPNKKIFRFDRDSITTDNRLRETIDAINKNDVDIIVGTQMITKGHDYHNISTVVVIGIDYIYSIPDYRAREKALATLIQISGRTGRKGEGEVYIYTKNREFFEKYIDNFEGFLRSELEQRIDLYPPFMNLATIHFYNRVDNIAETMMEVVLSKLEKFDSIEIVGYGKDSIEKLNNLFRYMIFIRSSSRKSLLSAIYSSIDNNCDVTIDPINI